MKEMSGWVCVPMFTCERGWRDIQDIILYCAYCILIYRLHFRALSWHAYTSDTFGRVVHIHHQVWMDITLGHKTQCNIYTWEVYCMREYHVSVGILLNSFYACKILHLYFWTYRISYRVSGGVPSPSSAIFRIFIIA